MPQLLCKNIQRTAQVAPNLQFVPNHSQYFVLQIGEQGAGSLLVLAIQPLPSRSVEIAATDLQDALVRPVNY